MHAVIMKMKDKHCKLDIIPTSTLKQRLEACLPAITQIVNTNSQPVPNKWRILQGLESCSCQTSTNKPSLDLISKNYRPISNLPFISKLVGKCMLKWLLEHCENHNLLPDFQSAYQKHYSTETSLIRLTNDILWSMERQHITALKILDLSAAFNTVDHNILL